MFSIRKVGSTLPPFQLGQGEHVLGRGDQLGIKDRVISRRLFGLHVGETVSIIAMQENSLLIRGSNGQERVVPTTTPVVLQGGDVLIIARIPDHQFVVEAFAEEDGTIDPDEILEDIDPCIAPSLKRAAEEEIEIEQPSTSRQKTELPPCEHGQFCARKHRPDHMEKFSHPPEVDSDDDDSPEWPCAQCTFMNAHWQSKCLMCEAPRDQPPTEAEAEAEADQPTGAPSHSIAFPSLSTGVFKFDPIIAADIIIGVISAFLAAHSDPSLRIFLVSPNSEDLALVRSTYQGDARFIICEGDLTRLKSNGPQECHYVVNSCNWRLKSGGSGVNRALFEAATSLAQGTQSQPKKTMMPGQCLLIPLAEDDKLRVDQGVRAVIHALGPNMNPDRPDCLHDVEEGRRLLRQTYESIFNEFAKSAGFIVPEVPRVEEEEEKKGWQISLAKYIDNPSAFPDVVVKETSDNLIIRDAYPKAKCHLLVVTKTGLSGPDFLTSEHIPMIESMYKEAKAVAREQVERDSSLNFIYGFHALPSLKPLHLHVISSDLKSPSLKKKKHWNSFTTGFFLQPSRIIKRLRTLGSLQIDRGAFEEMLKLPMKCTFCGEELKNIPSLKEHQEKDSCLPPQSLEFGDEM